jgi:hypothetical protein
MLPHLFRHEFGRCSTAEMAIIATATSSTQNCDLNIIVVFMVYALTQIVRIAV